MQLGTLWSWNPCERPRIDTWEGGDVFFTHGVLQASLKHLSQQRDVVPGKISFVAVEAILLQLAPDKGTIAMALEQRVSSRAHPGQKQGFQAGGIDLFDSFFGVKLARGVREAVAGNFGRGHFRWPPSLELGLCDGGALRMKNCVMEAAAVIGGRQSSSNGAGDSRANMW